ncbi:ferredoxin [Sphingomonas naphthae]|uniref:Ferredoxin n=1 Tax=Sphingomonas naphthae TaxID=1813468 RepID=A0ABY7TMT0_9SPHN|nr:ferredoxin [Sphingomonas naphthae]WCT74536.1 ferredoxin [Sphingomonas naphthae]
MKIKVEESWCVASGSCVLAAPKVFDQDENGVVILLQDRPAPELHASVRTAASVCPSAVISIEED